MKVLAIVVAGACWGQPLAPPQTPGALNPAVTQATINQTICVPNWTNTVRPTTTYTNKLKAAQMATLGLRGNPRQFEEDHRISLELGGNPTDPANLWPEPWKGPYNAHNKDRLENSVKRDVCAGRLSLAAGRAIFLSDWWVEYKRRFEKHARGGDAN